MMIMDTDEPGPYMSLINNIIRPPMGLGQQSTLIVQSEFPRAILTCHPNSHPFNNRSLDLSAPVKIGRAVNKCKASSNNAIFDCKVLSRNHAVIWYDQGKFYISDSKSSNGTFVNKERLSAANTDSAPREIYSNDVVQFGVDVTENNRKVTHGCIIATLTLYHPTGDEARSNPNPVTNATGRDSSGSNDYYNNGNNSLINSQYVATITTGQLVQLSTCLKEALKREESLESKIKSLETVLVKTCQSSEGSWKSCVQEDHLLSRIEALQFKLESLLTAFGMKTNDEMVNYLKNEVIKLHDLKEKYETEAKESVLSAQQSVCVSKSTISELEVSLNSALEESERLTSINLGLTEQLACLSEKYDSLINDLEEMEQKVKVNEEFLASQAVEFEGQKYNLTSSYELQIKSLNDKIDSLESEIEKIKGLVDERNQVENMNNLSNKLTFGRSTSPLVIDDNSNESEQGSFVGTNGDHAINLSNGVTNDNDLNPTVDQSNKSLNESNLHVSPSPVSSPNITSQLKCEIGLLKELLEETKAAKKDAETRVQSVEVDMKNMKSDAFHAKEDAKKSSEQLTIAKEKIDATNRTVETLLKELKNVQGQLKVSREDVTCLNQTLNLERMKSNTYIQSHQLPTENSEKQELLAQIKDLTCELSSIKEQVATQKRVQRKELEMDDEADGPKTLINVTSEQELIEKETELLSVKHKYEEIELKSAKLEEQVSILKDDLEQANYQNRVAFTCASVPLLMLILAIFAAFYPFFSSMTGTLES